MGQAGIASAQSGLCLRRGRGGPAAGRASPKLGAATATGRPRAGFTTSTDRAPLRPSRPTPPADPYRPAARAPQPSPAAQVRVPHPDPGFLLSGPGPSPLSSSPGSPFQVRVPRPDPGSSSPRSPFHAQGLYLVRPRAAPAQAWAPQPGSSSSGGPFQVRVPRPDPGFLLSWPGSLTRLLQPTIPLPGPGTASDPGFHLPKPGPRSPPPPSRPTPVPGPRRPSPGAAPSPATLPACLSPPGRPPRHSRGCGCGESRVNDRERVRGCSRGPRVGSGRCSPGGARRVASGAPRFSKNLVVSKPGVSNTMSSRGLASLCSAVRESRKLNQRPRAEQRPARPRPPFYNSNLPTRPHPPPKPTLYRGRKETPASSYCASAPVLQRAVLPSASSTSFRGLRSVAPRRRSAAWKPLPGGARRLAHARAC
uniref:Uncharacterized protein n=1 Tax=Mustela putorius furo TaxID=9669 RepID=M3Z795_MUSPF